MYLNIGYEWQSFMLKIRLIETRVVFEFNNIYIIYIIHFWLIETRVVFELNGKSQKLGILCRLIETRVVFEYLKFAQQDCLL